jgi:cysteine desulfurase
MAGSAPFSTTQPQASTGLYLDHAATTPLRPEVAEAMARAEAEGFGNPSSPHAVGRRARRLLEDSRERILELLAARATGVGRDRLVFTSGATEANRLGILGRRHPPAGIAAGSLRDHPGLRAAVADLAGRGHAVETLPLAPTGRIDEDALAAVTGRDLPLTVLSATLACGQTGTLEDLARLRSIVGPRVHVHADATQAAMMPLDFGALPADSLAFAPHKFEGPRGIGALVIRGGIDLVPLVPGPQESGLRGGTESVSLAVGFARAYELAVAERETVARHVAGLRDAFEAAVLAAARAAGIDALVIAAAERRIPHLTTIAFPGRDRQAFVVAADLAGVCCASGTACASGSSEPAPALLAMGLDQALVGSAVRFSFGRRSTHEDVAAAVRRLAAIIARRRS